MNIYMARQGTELGGFRTRCHALLASCCDDASAAMLLLPSTASHPSHSPGCVHPAVCTERVGLLVPPVFMSRAAAGCHTQLKAMGQSSELELAGLGWARVRG